MIEGSKTEQELINAFAGESQARNRYTFYAKVAKEEGHIQIANIFLETAENEKEHAKIFYKYIPSGLKKVNASYPFFIGTTEENLKAASMGERAEWETIYRRSAEIANDEGYKDVARSFLNIVEIEKHHDHRFTQLYDNLINKTIFKKEDNAQWICTKCGYIAISKSAPERCPACGHSYNYYQIFTEKY